MKIAVLGGGHGCYAAAADLSEQGHEVRFWRRDTQALQSLVQHPFIHIKDSEGERDVRIAKVCPDIGDAIRGAQLILIPSPAIAQLDIAKAMAPYLEDGQVVYLPPGTFGSYIMSEAVRAAGNKAEVTWAETGTLPWLENACRGCALPLPAAEPRTSVRVDAGGRDEPHRPARDVARGGRLDPDLPLVRVDPMVTGRAQQDQVAEIGPTAVRAPPQEVVSLGELRRSATECASPVAFDQCELLRAGEEAPRASEVEYLALAAEHTGDDLSVAGHATSRPRIDRLRDPVDGGDADS